jgi:hypothetical protein
MAGGLTKSFLLTEKVRMRFEATFTNILNHPNFAAPPTDVSSTSSFGVTQTVQAAKNGVTGRDHCRCELIFDLVRQRHALPHGVS